MTPVATEVSAGAPRRIGTWLTVLFLGALAALLLWRGWSYYRLGLEARPLHPEHRKLSPAGLIGHGYGIVGTAMVFTNLGYLIRRRFPRAFPAWMGTVKAWLNVHAFTGLAGSLLVVFHSAFQLRTPIATLTATSLGIVVVTGLVGFHLYSLVPKGGPSELGMRLVELDPLMPGMVAHVRDYLNNHPVTTLRHDASLARTLVTVPRWALQASRRRRGVKKAARGDKLFRVLHHCEPKLARAYVEGLAHLAGAEVDAQAGAAFLRSWRSLHRFLAILMLVSVSVHISVAWYYGFRWILP